MWYHRCGVLGSLGIDLYVGSAMALVCLAITVTANKVIHNRVLRQAESEVNPEENADLISNTDRNQPGSETQPSLRGLNSATKVTARGSSPSQARTERAASTPDRREPLSRKLRCLPTGAVEGPLAGDRTVLRAARWRDTYGLTLLFAKVEATTLKVLVLVALNCWNASSSIFEQYSLIAAIIFTLYYIFQGYFTYQFATCIWKEVTCSSLREQYSLTAAGKNNRGVESAGAEPPAATRNLEALLPAVMKGPNKDLRAVLFEDAAVPKNILQLLVPFVWQTRCFLLAVIAVAMARTPLAQVILALIVEIAYLVFIITSLKTESLADFLADSVGQTLLIVYLTLKAVTVGANLSEETNQLTLGYAMAWVLVIYGVLAVFATCYKSAKLLYHRVRKLEPVSALNDIRTRSTKSPNLVVFDRLKSSISKVGPHSLRKLSPQIRTGPQFKVNLQRILSKKGPVN